MTKQLQEERMLIELRELLDLREYLLKGRLAASTDHLGHVIDSGEFYFCSLIAQSCRASNLFIFCCFGERLALCSVFIVLTHPSTHMGLDILRVLVIGLHSPCPFLDSFRI